MEVNADFIEKTQKDVSNRSGTIWKNSTDLYSALWTLHPAAGMHET